MPIQVSPTVAEQLRTDKIDYAFNGITGGVEKKKYYTPDGRVIFAIPDIRYRVKKDGAGKIIWAGEVDGNLDNGEFSLPSDRGWLIRPPSPSEKKVMCTSCARWHDTEEQVRECKRTQDRKVAGYERRVKKDRLKERQDRDLQIDALSSQVMALTQQVTKLTETLMGSKGAG